VLGIVVAILCYFFTEDMFIVFLIISGIVGLLGIFWFSNEILVIIPEKYLLKVRIYKFIKIKDLISSSFAITLVVLMFCYQDSFLINDIIVICVTGCLVKLFKATSMKSILIFYCITSGFEIIAGIIIG